MAVSLPHGAGLHEEGLSQPPYRSGDLGRLPCYTPSPTCGIAKTCGKVPMADTETKSILEAEPDAAEEARLDAEAWAAYKAGRVMPHAKVVEWLKSWGTSNVLPRPTPKPR